MFNKELYNSGMTKLNEEFRGIFDDFMRRKGDEAQSPALIAKEFPIEIIPYENIFEVLHEAIQKKGYGHYGCFFKCEQSNMARDGRITRPKVFSDFRQIVCLRGEIYELVTNGEWHERKVYQDIHGKWHLWDGTYNIEIWVDVNKRTLINNPTKPIKIYPEE